jgi:peptide/nickel transport system ATP-binding protein
MKDDTTPILQLRDITKVYKTRGSLFGKTGHEVVALNHISFEVGSGEIFGLVGESGSGKTTCGRLIVRLEDPKSGEIHMDGQEITQLKGRVLKDFRRRVQMIFQDPYQSLNSQLSIFESVAEPLIIHHLGNGSERWQRVLDTLKVVGLSPPEDFISCYPHQLSGGQRQRVAIARAMVLDPDLVVADEPTSMLDASYSAKIFNILRKVRDTINVSILFITHSLSAARYLCDRIAVLYRGNLMEIGPADDVIKTPKHPYTQALIDALPRFGDSIDTQRYNTLLLKARTDEDGLGCPFLIRCRKAKPDRCGSGSPPMIQIEKDHFSSCFLSDQEA